MKTPSTAGKKHLNSSSSRKSFEEGYYGGNILDNRVGSWVESRYGNMLTYDSGRIAEPEIQIIINYSMPTLMGSWVCYTNYLTNSRCLSETKPLSQSFGRYERPWIALSVSTATWLIRSQCHFWPVSYTFDSFNRLLMKDYKIITSKWWHSHFPLQLQSWHFNVRENSKCITRVY